MTDHILRSGQSAGTRCKHSVRLHVRAPAAPRARQGPGGVPGGGGWGAGLGGLGEGVQPQVVQRSGPVADRAAPPQCHFKAPPHARGADTKATVSLVTTRLVQLRNDSAI